MKYEWNRSIQFRKELKVFLTADGNFLRFIKVIDLWCEVGSVAWRSRHNWHFPNNSSELSTISLPLVVWNPERKVKVAAVKLPFWITQPGTRRSSSVSIDLSTISASLKVFQSISVLARWDPGAGYCCMLWYKVNGILPCSAHRYKNPNQNLSPLIETTSSRPSNYLFFKLNYPNIIFNLMSTKLFKTSHNGGVHIEHLLLCEMWTFNYHNHTPRYNDFSIIVGSFPTCNQIDEIDFIVIHHSSVHVLFGL